MPSLLYTKTEKSPRLLELLDAQTDLIVNAINSISSMTEETQQKYFNKNKEIIQGLVEYLDSLNPGWGTKTTLYFFGASLSPKLDSDSAVKFFAGSFSMILLQAKDLHDKNWADYEHRKKSGS